MDFWLAIEAFSPQQVPKVSSSLAEEPFIWDYPGRRSLPWEDGPSRTPKPGYAWRHTVFVGIFDLQSAWDVLEPADVEDPNRRNPGQSAAVGLVVSDDGVLSPESLVLAQCIWAVGRYRQHHSLDAVLESFAADEARWRAQLEELVVARGIRTTAGEPDTARTHAVTVDDLQAIIEATLQATGTADVLSYRGMKPTIARIRSEQVRTKDLEELTEPVFFNSPYFADLLRIGQTTSRTGAAIQYLGGDNPARVDVRNELGAVYDAVAPGFLPQGRWPVNVTHSLALSQQFAVNRAVNDLSGGEGLFSVNGPPGTGKTTMLRDLIAALVTQRAAALAALASPAKAFVASTKIATAQGGHCTVHLLHESLRGFEMIIASSNNGAVENISMNIPLRNKDVIDLERFGSAGYFPQIATRLLSRPSRGKQSADHAPSPGQEAGPEGWGLIAAKLGNRRNVGAFLAGAFSDERKKPGDTAPARLGLLALLKSPPPPGTKSWAEARGEFLDAQHRVEELTQERQQLHQAHLRLPRLERDEAAASLATEETSAALWAAERTVLGLEAEHEALEQKVHANQQDMTQHLEAKPGVLEQLFSFGAAMRPWREEYLRLSDDRQRLHHEDTSLMQQLAVASEQSALRREHHQDRLNTVLAARKRKQDALDLLGTYPTGKHKPGADWFKPGSDQREHCSPWLDEKYNRARSELFLAALALHEAFIRDQHVKMHQNLLAAREVLRNAVSSTVDPVAVRAAWEALFLVVPTITTTFASVPKLFASLKNEALGWLFIDEAGQSAPQAAYCGIARARRAVLVGDPLQLAPIVTLPAEYQKRLLEITRSSPKWSPSKNPAQVLADRTTTFGTLIHPPGQDPTWVGAPLRIHRRCDDPMFTAVNTQVYDGLMIHGESNTHPRFPKSPDRTVGPESSWLHVTTLNWDSKHTSRQELDRYEELLGALKEQGYDMSEVLTIAPFKDVAAALTRPSKRHGMDPAIQAGTVHRAQGKEADIVILVLGGSTAGARSWAVGTPELFNVAASRAKHRLYIIGNQHAWGQLEYFTYLASQLKTHPESQDLKDLFTQPENKVQAPETPEAPAGHGAESAPQQNTAGPEPGLDVRTPAVLVDDQGQAVDRSQYWGQTEIGAHLGISAKKAGDLLRERGLLHPGADKLPTPLALDLGLALWVSVNTSTGSYRYVRWHRDKTLAHLQTRP